MRNGLLTPRYMSRTRRKRVRQRLRFLGGKALLRRANALVGFAVGASSGNDRPQLTATLTTAKAEQTTAVSATATRSAVSRSHVLVMTIWGFDASTSVFRQLRYDVVGPTASGNVGSRCGRDGSRGRVQGLSCDCGHRNSTGYPVSGAAKQLPAGTKQHAGPPQHASRSKRVVRGSNPVSATER